MFQSNTFTPLAPSAGDAPRESASDGGCPLGGREPKPWAIEPAQRRPFPRNAATESKIFAARSFARWAVRGLALLVAASFATGCIVHVPARSRPRRETVVVVKHKSYAKRSERSRAREARRRRRVAYD